MFNLQKNIFINYYIFIILGGADLLYFAMVYGPGTKAHPPQESFWVQGKLQTRGKFNPADFDFILVFALLRPYFTTINFVFKHKSESKMQNL